MPDTYWAERERLLQALGVKLRFAREQCGLSQEALAHAADVHRTQICALELGKRDPHVSMVLILADALAVPPASLFDGLPVPQKRRPATHSKGGWTP